MPSLTDVLPCETRALCHSCGAGAIAAGALSKAMAMLSSTELSIRSGGAFILAGLASGAPSEGKCTIRDRVLAEAVSSGVLPSLLKMISAVSNLDPGAAAAGVAPESECVCEREKMISAVSNLDPGAAAAGFGPKAYTNEPQTLNPKS